jgi:hypothetical protein
MSQCVTLKERAMTYDFYKLPLPVPERDERALSATKN